MTIHTPQDAGRPFGGPEKIAAVLLALDREASSRVLKHFDHGELKQIARVAATLDVVPSATLEEICTGLIEEISNGQPDLQGGESVAEDLLASALPDEQVADIMSELRGRSNKFLWRRIGALSDQLLAGYLTNEHPQTAVIMLSRVDPAVAARVLGLLPSMLRSQAMRRMLVSKPVSEHVLHIVEEALQEDLFAAASAPSTNEVSARVAGIVNQLEREQIVEIIEGIAQSEPVLAEQLKSMIFSFEDIVGLSERARMIIFDQVQIDRLILALRGADAAVRAAVVPCLSTRTRRMVEAELASASEPPRKEVVAAQREIASLTLRLSSQGLIDLAAERRGEAA
ncbi:FliG C-terminal domain-containing protein [Methylocystis echinoides]|uniref:flagellar motor switch protein FliG n=1 Tax=Methylocystis echinoides TaxID=29468 RepID=UPI0034223D07